MSKTDPLYYQDWDRTELIAECVRLNKRIEEHSKRVADIVKGNFKDSALYDDAGYLND